MAHHLFLQTNVFELMQERHHQLRNALMNFPHTEFDDEQLSDRLAAEHGLVVPILKENDKHATKKQVNVDVSQDLNRRIFNRSKPFNVPATELMIHIPFEGDANLFDVRPATFDNAPPWGEFDDRELRLVYQIIEPRDVESEIERTLGQVRKYLEWLRPSAVQLQAQLKQLSASLIAEWKQRTTAHNEVLGRLGIPLRPEPEQPASVVARTGRRKASEQSERWDVFISHASEDKDVIARPLADELKARGLSIWYDGFSLKLGDSLRQSIDKGLSCSRFGVVILSPRFFEKHWPQQELNGLVTREVNGQKVILPVWHDVGFEEVRNYSPVLADRIGVRTDLGLPEVISRILDAMK